jgi:hypothetical protein
MFGTLPATGFFLRHAKNLEFSNVEIAAEMADARPAIWADDVDGLDLFRLRVPKGSAAFSLRDVRDFHSFGSAYLKDRSAEKIDREQW